VEPQVLKRNVRAHHQTVWHHKLHHGSRASMLARSYEARMHQATRRKLFVQAKRRCAI
jgi:hypothetical protein